MSGGEERGRQRLHRHLARQLRKLGLDDPNRVPGPEAWRALLEGVSKSYEDIDLERYTLERSLALFDREMKELNGKLAAERDHLRLILDAAPVGIIRCEADRRITRANAAIQTMLGYTQDELFAIDPGQLVHREDRDEVLAALTGRADGTRADLSVATRRFVHKNGSVVHTNVAVAVVAAAAGRPPFTIAVVKDISDRIQLEVELRHAQKLESVGRLAAGIAHEINTPVQFVGDSVHFVSDAIDGLTIAIRAYEDLGERLLQDPAHAAEAARLVETEAEHDVPYLLENLPGALARCTEGLERVATIVRSMKEFAHPDGREKRPQDLNHAIDTTLAIARNEYKYVADIETHFGDLPPVLCHAGEMNQVFLNIIVNAAHAIGDVVRGTTKRGVIRITTRREGGQVVVEVSDTGAGIPTSVRERIFEPFFTTKEVGRGTGQGLAISRSVVVDKHGGTLTFETELGRGTTFVVRLPIADERRTSPRAAAVAA